MYGYAKGPELSVLALPPELLRRVVDVISNITHLWTRAQVSLVSKVFAAAVKEQHKLVISGAFLINQDEQFMLASLKQVPTAFVHVTQLTLTDIQRYSLSWSCSLASQSSLLKTLTIQLRTGSCDYASDVVAGEIFNLLLRQCGPRSGVLQNLQQLSITKGNCVMLRMESPEGPLFQHDKLDCITAGRLPVLRNITHSSLELLELGRNTQLASRDVFVLCRLPGLDWLEIGSETLNAIFKGTVRGRLTSETADVFRQATISHVYGPCHREERLNLMEPVSSITSWCSDMVEVPARITRFAPNLTIMNVKISNACWGSSLCVWLTLRMVSVDVQCIDPNGVLRINGIPSTSLTHLCIQSHTLHVKKDLYSWVDARSHQGYRAQNLRLSILDKQIVILQPTECATTVTLQC